MKRIIFLLLLISFFNSFSQNAVEVKHENDALGDVWFRVYNDYDFPVFLVIDFSFINYTQFDGELPFIKKINPGVTDLFTLRKESDQHYPEFNYSYKWFMAHPNPIIDEAFPYLLPIKAGKSSAIFHISNSNGFLGKQVYGMWYSLGFTLNQEDTICASRKGLVIGVNEGLESSQHNMKEYQLVSNSVRLLHDDGTVAEYTGFGKNQVTCEKGELIYPGQTLGKAGKNGYVGLTIFHSDLRSGNYKIIIPQFYVQGGVKELLVPNVYYTEHPAEFIGKEMTKKERKNFFKK